MGLKYIAYRRNLIKKPWVFMRALYMNPNTGGAGFPNQLPILGLKNLIKSLNSKLKPLNPKP